MLEETEVLRSLEREKANLEWITASLTLLRKEFGDRYIAVQGQEVVDSDADFEALLARVRELEDPESITIEYSTAVEHLWML